MRKFLSIAVALFFISCNAIFCEQTGGGMFGLPNATKANITVVTPVEASNGTTWYAWSKPKGCSMIYIIGVGGGAGGGAGFTGIATSARGGGGGGGTGGIVRLFGPACMFPDTLYLSAGYGGLGGPASGSAGSNGNASWVSAGPYPAGTSANFTAAANVFLKANEGNAGGGGAGTVAAAGAAGTAAAIGVITTQTRGGYALFWNATVGLVGFIGGAVADAAGTASSNVLSAGVPMAGGAGGGGVTNTGSAGGAVTGAGIFQTIPGGAFAGDINGGNGYSWDGQTMSGPYFLASTSGSGGAGVNSGVGGNGGNGGFPGSGGGGGGGGTAGGSGGKGGDGCIVIVAW